MSYKWVIQTPAVPYIAYFVGSDGVLYGTVSQDPTGTIEAKAFNASFQRQYDRSTSINDARLWVQKQFNVPGTIITL